MGKIHEYNMAVSVSVHIGEIRGKRKCKATIGHAYVTLMSKVFYPFHQWLPVLQINVTYQIQQSSS